MAKDIFYYQAKEATPKIKIEDGGDKHVNMLEAIAPYAKPNISKNLTQVEIPHNTTKNTKVVMILMPEWNEYFPPFALGRLTALAKRAGYQTKSFDLNIKAHNYFHSLNPKPVDFNPWEPGRFFHWQYHYLETLHPIFENLWLEYIEQIVEYNPNFVGFTAYYCNFGPVRWFAEELKKRLPDVKLGIGGPYMQTSHMKVEEENFFDYGVIGEGEILFLKMLEEAESGVKHDNIKIFSQPENQRINLNNMPVPDYENIDFNDYRFPNGILTEFSRGCVAKCTFCDETHFWKYRQRQAVDAIEEIEHLYYSKGTDVIWFIDSLVNGNLNELRAFAKGVAAKGLQIHWTGYARCDGRMDLDYYKDLAASGCSMLNYGCETASNKVLEDMDKKVTRAEMEQNFRDSHKAGVAIMTNWVLGYPTETPNDICDSMTFLYRMKRMSLVTISHAAGFVLGPNSIIGQNFERFNLANVQYCNHWINLDYSFGKGHILTRSKMFSIWLQQMKLPERIAYLNRPDLPVNHYTIEYDNDEIEEPLNYEVFDYNIIKTGISDWADNMMNELFVVFRLLWRARGGYKMNVKFNPEIDLKEFGENYAGEYTCNATFTIDYEGNWKLDIDAEWVQPEWDEIGGKWNFQYHEFSQYENSAALRARKLAKSKYGMEGITEEDKNYWQETARNLNKELDLSFKTSIGISGKWERPVPYLSV